MTNVYPDKQQIPIVATGSAINVQLDYLPTYLRIDNLTNQLTPASATASLQYAEWYTGMVNGSVRTTGTLGGATNPATLLGGYAAANGFYVSTPLDATPWTQYSFTAISNANTSVITVASTATIPTTGVMFIQFATGMSQVQGMFLSYSVSNATTISLPYLNAAGFASPGTTGSFQIVNGLNQLGNYLPNNITALVTGRTTTVQFGSTITYKVGQYLYLNIPQIFGQGVSQFFTINPYASILNNYAGYEILSINAAANTLVLNADTSTVSGGFVFPSDAAVQALPAKSYGQPPVAMMVGQNTLYQTGLLAGGTSGAIILSIGTVIAGAATNNLLLTIEADQLLTATLL